MTETVLRIPIVQATEWNLEEAMMSAAEKAGLSYDGSEEEGGFEVHFFQGISAPDLLAFAATVLPRRGTSLAVTGEHEVTVTAPDLGWLIPLGVVEHSYDRALRKLARKIAADPRWLAWWRQTGHSALEILPGEHRVPPVVEFRVQDGVLQAGNGLDLSQADISPAKAAQQNLMIILDAAAGYLDHPHPGALPP